LAKVPAFIAANTFAGFVSFGAGPGPAAAIDGGSGGTGPGPTPLPNGDCPKPGLNPVGSVKRHAFNVSGIPKCKRRER
jgi:hypothetical protein